MPFSAARLACTSEKLRSRSCFLFCAFPPLFEGATDDPKHALGLVQYLRTIGYNAWIEHTNGNEIDEKALKMAIAGDADNAVDQV